MPRILVIDDVESICEGVKSILEKEGYEVDTSLSGESGIEKIKTADYDLIDLDIHMPGMSGLETFRNIKKIKKDAKVCIITAMSDDRMMEYLLLLKEGAIDKIVRKPVFQDMLLKTTKELVGEAKSRNDILVIDDEEIIRSSFKAVLKDAGYTVDFAVSAEEGARLFKSGKYKLVFLDLALPDGSGEKLLGQLRLIDADVKICVISGFLSKLGNLLQKHDQAISNTLFCMKPVSREDIIKITKSALSKP